MSYRKGNSRVRYTTALYAAAIAALLSACSRTDVTAEQPAARPAVIHLSESGSTADAADMPEVVVSARREQPKAIG